MKFKKLNGWIEDSPFISIEIENGDNNDSIGDQVWINKNGTEMRVLENSDKTILEETMHLFKSPSSKRAFKGALMRMGIYF